MLMEMRTIRDEVKVEVEVISTRTARAVTGTRKERTGNRTEGTGYRTATAVTGAAIKA